MSDNKIYHPLEVRATRKLRFKAVVHFVSWGAIVAVPGVAAFPQSMPTQNGPL